AVVGALARYSATGSARLGVVLVLLCLALGLAAWFGLDQTHGRLATLWKSNHREDRWQLWVQTAPSAREFPVWGAGFTTFAFLERMSGPPGTGIDFVYDNAHNEYLNLLLEGGLVGLALALAALALAWARGARAYRRHREGPAGGLALGGLLAL